MMPIETNNKASSAFQHIVHPPVDESVPVQLWSTSGMPPIPTDQRNIPSLSPSSLSLPKFSLTATKRLPAQQASNTSSVKAFTPPTPAPMHPPLVLRRRPTLEKRSSSPAAPSTAPNSCSFLAS